MRRRLTRPLAAAIAVLVLAACGGAGPSAKDRAVEVAIAYRRAGNEHDYATEWKLIKAADRGGYESAEEYAANEVEHRIGGDLPGVAGLRYAAEVVTKEGDFYRVRVRVTDPDDTGDANRSDVIVGHYDDQWLVAGSVEPGYPITPEDVE